MREAAGCDLRPRAIYRPPGGKRCHASRSGTRQAVYYAPSSKKPTLRHREPGDPSGFEQLAQAADAVDATVKAMELPAQAAALSCRATPAQLRNGCCTSQ
jgi:hypothetical protein